MKKFSCVLLSLIFVFSLSAFGCKDFSYGLPCADGEHTYGAYVYQNDATCIDDGTEIARCKNPYCPAKLTRTVDNSKLGHNPVYQPKSESTCYKRGCSIDCYECSRCHNHFYDENAEDMIEQSDYEALLLPIADHDYEAHYTVDVKPNYFDDGIESRHCVNFIHCKSRFDPRTKPSKNNDGLWGGLV